MPHGEPAVWPWKGHACQAGSLRVSNCAAAPECAVSQGRSGAGTGALCRGFLEKAYSTSKVDPVESVEVVSEALWMSV